MKISCWIWLLIPLSIGGCALESASGPEQPSTPAEPSGSRLSATFAGTAAQAFERLDPRRLQAEQTRIDTLARHALGASDPAAPWQPVLQRILFRPDGRQIAEYREQFRGIPIIATPIRVVIRGHEVVRIEGRPLPPPDDFGIKPAIDQQAAEELARIYVSSLPNAPAQSRLVILHEPEDRGEALRLAWQIDLPGIRVWIDAREGRMLRHQRR